MPDPNMTEEEREHLKSLADQAKREMAEASPVPEGFGEQTEEEKAMIERLSEQVREIQGREAAPADDLGYDIPAPPTPEQVEQGKTSDDRIGVPTAFLVYVDPETGRAIATSEVDATLAQIRIEGESDLADIRRYCAEVIEDIRITLMTQSVINTQMAYARQVQEQMKNAQVAQGLDLSQMRSNGA